MMMCVVCDLELIERLHQLADDPIHLKNEITVRSRLGFSLELIRREGGQVHRLHGMEKEERLPGF